MINVKSETVMAIKKNAQFILDSLCDEKLTPELSCVKQYAQGILSYVGLIEQALYLSRTKKEPPKMDI